MKIFSFLFGIGFVINSVGFLFQAAENVYYKSTENISLLMLSSFLIFQIGGVGHGIRKKDKIVLRGSACILAANLIAIGTTIFYRF